MAKRLSLTLLIFLVLRVLILAFFPVLGDEAYYFYWGMHPAGGYYDLPPMIGWWIAPFVKVGLSPFWLRIPNLLSWLLISLSIYEWLSHAVAKPRAQLIAAIFAILPLPFLAVLMFPDIPLLLFSYFSAYLFFRSVWLKQGRHFSFLFSGALLGAAVLSKYFAIFLLPALLLWYFSPINRLRRGWDLSWFILGGAPFALQHFFWNETHCWSNFVFNLVTRQKVSDGPIFQIVGLFLLYLLMLSFPFFQTAVFGRAEIDLSEGAEKGELTLALSQYLQTLWSLPVLIFLGTALLGRGQGFHWLLFVLPFFIMGSGLKLSATELQKSFNLTARVTGMLALLGVAVSLAPEKTLGSFFQHRFQFEFAQATHEDELVQKILPDVSSADYVFTEGYTFSSQLHYALQRYARSHSLELPEVSVWGSGSRFGRVFDWTTDFTKLDGKKLVIITPGRFSPEWSSYFSSMKTEDRELAGIPFRVTTGVGFKAADYLKNEFRKPIETYYAELPPRCSLWEITHQRISR